MTPEKDKTALVWFPFVRAMGRKLQDGLEKKDRVVDDWQELTGPENELEFRSALLRHYEKYVEATDDPALAFRHLAAVAVNAMFLAYHVARKHAF